jgi:hypothetical protein
MRRRYEVATFVRVWAEDPRVSQGTYIPAVLRFNPILTRIFSPRNVVGTKVEPEGQVLLLERFAIKKGTEIDGCGVNADQPLHTHLIGVQTYEAFPAN